MSLILLDYGGEFMEDETNFLTIKEPCPENPQREDLFVMDNGIKRLWICGNTGVEYEVGQ